MRHYELSVWNNVTGDVVRKEWDADDDMYDMLCEEYADEPGHNVVIDNEWETDDELDPDRMLEDWKEKRSLNK